MSVTLVSFFFCFCYEVLFSFHIYYKATNLNYSVCDHCLRFFLLSSVFSPSCCCNECARKNSPASILVLSVHTISLRIWRTAQIDTLKPVTHSTTDWVVYCICFLKLFMLQYDSTSCSSEPIVWNDESCMKRIDNEFIGQILARTAFGIFVWFMIRTNEAEWKIDQFEKLMACHTSNTVIITRPFTANTLNDQYSFTCSNKFKDEKKNVFDYMELFTLFA